MHINSKPIMLRDEKALKLIKQRAFRESRSAANAAAVTIIEALSGPNNANSNTENRFGQVEKKN